MNIDEKLAKFKRLISPDIADNDTLLDYLQDAQEIVLNKLYEVAKRPDNVVMPSRYDTLQVRIAIELYAKKGAEGETSHNENGISRTYENASVSPSLLREIKPYVGTIQ